MVNNMKDIKLVVPSIEDIKYRKEWMKDPKTMAYNAGYDLDIKGYDKSTGIINKTDEEMIEWYNKWIGFEPDKYYAYIYVDDIEEPVGEVYYYLNGDIHSMGIVIQDKYRKQGYSQKALLELEKVAFEINGINELSDIIPVERISAIKAFENAGFSKLDIDNNNLKQMLITKEMYFNK